MMSDTGATSTGTITSLLREAEAGNRLALEQVFHRVQGDLRGMARGVLRGGGWQNLQGTELVNMACERLLKREQLNAEDRRHFFFLFGRAMRDILVEEARAAHAAKRGGGRKPSPEVDFAVDGGRTRFGVLALHEALELLKEHDPEGVRVVELRFFAGRTLEETAELMGCTVGVVRGHWAYAKAWLAARLEHPQ